MHTQGGVSFFQNKFSRVIRYNTMTTQQQLFVIDQIRLCMQTVREEHESQLMHSNIKWRTALQMGGSCVLYGDDANSCRHYVQQLDALKAAIFLIMKQSATESDVLTRKKMCNIIIQRVCSQTRVCKEVQFELTKYIQSIVECDQLPCLDA